MKSLCINFHKLLIEFFWSLHRHFEYCNVIIFVKIMPSSSVIMFRNPLKYKPTNNHKHSKWKEETKHQKFFLILSCCYLIFSLQSVFIFIFLCFFLNSIFGVFLFVHSLLVFFPLSIHFTFWLPSPSFKHIASNKVKSVFEHLFLFQWRNPFDFSASSPKHNNCYNGYRKGLPMLQTVW